MAETKGWPRVWGQRVGMGQAVLGAASAIDPRPAGDPGQAWE